MLAALKIDKGVPIPQERAVRRRWPFDRMAVGDSFFVEGYSSTQVTQAARYQQAYGRRFISRATVENGTHGARCWRVA